MGIYPLPTLRLPDSRPEEHGDGKSKEQEELARRLALARRVPCIGE